MDFAQGTEITVVFSRIAPRQSLGYFPARVRNKDWVGDYSGKPARRRPSSMCVRWASERLRLCGCVRARCGASLDGRPGLAVRPSGCRARPTRPIGRGGGSHRGASHTAAGSDRTGRAVMAGAFTGQQVAHVDQPALAGPGASLAGSASDVSNHPDLAAASWAHPYWLG